MPEEAFAKHDLPMQVPCALPLCLPKEERHQPMCKLHTMSPRIARRIMPGRVVQAAGKALWGRWTGCPGHPGSQHHGPSTSGRSVQQEDAAAQNKNTRPQRELYQWPELGQPDRTTLQNCPGATQLGTAVGSLEAANLTGTDHTGHRTHPSGGQDSPSSPKDNHTPPREAAGKQGLAAPRKGPPGGAWAKQECPVFAAEHHQEGSEANMLVKAM